MRERVRSRCTRLALSAAAVLSPSVGLAQLTGELGSHDPSSLTKQGSTYYYFATGNGIAVRSSTNRINWTGNTPVFATPPAWTTQAVPSFTGTFWAPDIAYFNGLYHLYYSVSQWATNDSAIGVATTPSLTSPVWTDRGKVVQSDASGNAGPNTDTTSLNAIDPSLFVDTDNRVYMTFGSYFSGIAVTEIEPSTGKRKSGSPLTVIANNSTGGNGGGGNGLEASALMKRGSYYYLFVNEGTCCSGVDSTYRIRMGRATSPTGPFLDQNGVNLANGGGTLFLDDEGERIGPGHFSFFSESGQDSFGYHYYNGDANGAPTYGLRNLYWTADNWPSYAVVNQRWTGTASALWSNASNWGGIVPDGVGHVANFAGNTANRYSVGLDGVGRTLSSVNFQTASSYLVGSSAGNTLTLDAEPGYTATINVADGNHTIGAPINALDRLGVNVTPADRTLTLGGTVSGTTLVKYGAGALTLSGSNTYTGNVFIKRGTITVLGSVSAGQFVSVGQSLGDSGTLVVRGSGSFSATSDLNVGDTGNANTAATGTLEIRDNATITVGTAGAFVVGSGFNTNTRGVGTVNQSGGTLNANGNFDGAFIVGGRGSSLATGTYNLSGGVVNANTNVRIGGRGSGTMTQTGGTFNTTGYVAIGRYAGSTGNWTIDGGSFNHTNAATRIIVGEGGVGSLTIDGTGAVTTAAVLTLGQNAGSSGTVSLNGGVLVAPALSRGAGAGTVVFDGGTLRATQNSSNYLQSLSSVYVRAGGATLDTQSYDVTVAGALLHDPALGSTLGGGLQKLGSGSLTLGTSSTFTGPIQVSGGSLTFASSQVTPRALVMATGTSAAMAPAGSRVLSLTQLTIAGGSTFELNDNSLLLGFISATDAKDLVRALVAGDQLLATTSTSGVAIGFAALSSLGVASWDGVPSPNGGNALLIRSALLGDTDFNGTVDFNDLLDLARNYNTTTPANDWSTGDFDLDTTVGFNDLLALARNYGRSALVSDADGSSFPADWNLARALVPEPGLAGFLGAAMFPRRRRRLTSGD